MRKTLSIIGIFALVSMASYSQSEAAVEDGVIIRVKVSLSDGSTLLGTPHFTSLTLATDFGQQQIPLTLVSTLDIGKNGVKIKFANKDTLSGILEDSAFKIATSFGDVALEYTHVASMAFSRQRNVKGGEPGLLLHVPLDTENASLEIFDARMETRNVRIVDGRGEKAMAFDSTNSSATIHLPFLPNIMNEGTIEFWAKIPNPHQNFPSSDRHPNFISIVRQGVSLFCLGFTYNNGLGKGGLAGLIPDFSVATHDYGVASTIASTELLGGAASDWHHYALVWKRDGFEFPEARGEKILLAVDGKIVAIGQALSPYDGIRNVSNDRNANLCLIINDTDRSRSSRPNTNPFEMSDLKIWDYAKLPVAE